VVNLVATPEADYHFVNWAGDVRTITNRNDATTTITTSGNYFIIANFACTLQCTTMVAAGGYHTVGLKSDGTVLAVGDNEYGQCDVGGWTGIVQVAAGRWHTVGLKSDGTVVATGLIGELAQWNLGIV
jgi:alpha-tubulin suppressor-like RCC1 family protein